MSAGTRRAQRRSLAAIAAVVLGLHAAGIALLLAVLAPRHVALGGGGVLGVGAGLTAYTLGLRHAFDADHIAAIHNTTRKLISDGQRPAGVGLFFSLGHATVVLVLSVALASGVHSLAGPVRDGGSALHAAGDLIGTSVSGLFLCLIAALNLATLRSLLGIARRAQGEGLEEKPLEFALQPRGPMGRLLAPFTRAVGRSWHMFGVGFLFGLGFDTATEVALLALTVGAASGGVPFTAILCLPVLFAAGMSLMDTIDGAFMSRAYGWALVQPARRLYYNIVVTALSVAAALLIGGLELLSVLAQQLSLSGGIWSALRGLDLNTAGVMLAVLFALTWAGAAVIWRTVGIEERLQPRRPE